MLFIEQYMCVNIIITIIIMILLMIFKKLIHQFTEILKPIDDFIGRVLDCDNVSHLLGHVVEAVACYHTVGVLQNMIMLMVAMVLKMRVWRIMSGRL